MDKDWKIAAAKILMEESAPPLNADGMTHLYYTIAKLYKEAYESVALDLQAEKESHA